MIKFEDSVMITDEAVQCAPEVQSIIRNSMTKAMINKIWYDERNDLHRHDIDLMVTRGAQFRTVWYPKSKMWRLNIQVFIPEVVPLFEKPE